MQRYLRTLLALLIASAAPACGALDLLGLSTEQEPGDFSTPLLRTDSTVYHVRTTESFYELNIGLAFTNRMGGTVEIPTCHTPSPPILEKWEDGKWVTAYSPVVLLCLTSPVVIRPGEVYTYRYRISAGHRGNIYPRWQVAEIPGLYRLDWRGLGARAGDDGGGSLPLEQRVSNTFRIER